MRPRDGWPGRAALAVVALYGLLLSTVLGAMAPAGLLPGGVICTRDGAGPATPALPAGHGRDCCTAGCASPAGAPPPRPFAPARAEPSAATPRQYARPGLPPSPRLGRARLPRGPPIV